MCSFDLNTIPCDLLTFLSFSTFRDFFYTRDHYFSFAVNTIQNWAVYLSQTIHVYIISELLMLRRGVNLNIKNSDHQSTCWTGLWLIDCFKFCLTWSTNCATHIVDSCIMYTVIFIIYWIYESLSEKDQ